MSQIQLGLGGGGGSALNTLSGENGPITGPLGNNFNFSGTPGGGYGANGAIEFATAGAGEMNAQVRVDGVTVVINPANQLQSTVGGIFSWFVVAVPTLLNPASGYISTAGGANTFTLPAIGSAVGVTTSVYAYSGTIEINQAAGQRIQFNNQQTTVGGGNKLVSTMQGNALTLVCAGVIAAEEWWIAFPNQGQFLVS